ncbi:MAG: tetratricopeptide repeat protein [Rhodocyclaceae bacterium]|jgi:protein O-GlcNAc transferase|nr:tetratricopeptide repeat protein [Rhodocyclaceae bacterium]MCA3025657.1 tetratricopeptide repeat protein [Rhodocyclaceae bacterium]MCA3029318.1 tetratricopeptide repeat protein [Rhodocyclaceae bacterium]MCA3030804.1 tetratricopeptide repeat protein [Rhodocyclaceae bacterium]MCA3036022.1 tetratricopeptide repeat protein [Rhodocyclaceae bacterium]
MSSEIEQVAEAQRLKDSGNLAAAEELCSRLIANRPRNAGALHLLGVILHLRGRQQDAIKLLQQAIEADPKNASYLVTLGGNFAIAGQMDKATACFQKAVATDPSSVEAHYNLGLALKHQKQFANAESCFLEALALAPAYVDAIANLGFVVLNQGRPDEAKEIFSRALILAPTNPLSLTSLAKILAKEGKRNEAEALLRAFDPEPSEASLYQLASAYDHLSNNALSISALRHLVAKFPHSAEAHAALATALVGDLQMAEGILIGKKAISLDSKSASAWCSLGMAYQHNGLYDEAYEAFTRTLALTSAIGPRVMRDLMLPCIMGTNDEVQKSRQTFERNLDNLISENLISTNPFAEIGFTYFYLAYHGVNDVDLQKKIARFYQKIAPSLNFVAPHCHSEQRQKKRHVKTRVGFYSHFISTHSVSVCFAKVLEGLSVTDEFEIYLITDAPVTDKGVEKMYPSLKNRAVQTARDLLSAQNMVSSLELDVLVYLDIGMDPLTFLLAFSRLAPVQCVMTGHPVTTGISTIDYFLSGELTEPPDGDDHYSEKLIRFKHVGFVFERPEMPQLVKTRTELGMPNSVRLYTCPMMLQKIHPDFDEAIEKILKLDQNGVVLFVESAQSPAWGQLLRSRFDKTIDSSLRNRIVFIPWLLNQQDFICMIAQSDVILDPFHFGIGTTSIFVCAAGTPFVTKPGKFMRGRAGYAYCKLVDIPECITSDVDSYAAMATQIASDGPLRARLRATILQNNHRIFENDAAAPEFAQTIRQLAADPVEAI